MNRFAQFLLCCLCIGSFSESTFAKTQGLSNAYMEAGVALVGQFNADYRGSEHYQPYALPLPYFLYHGTVIKADKDGVRGELWANNEIELSVSVDASLHGRSDHNRLREGMPNLDSAFEIGPSLNLLLSGKSFRDGWSARFPVRSVFTVGSHGLDSIGYLFSPRLTWRKPNVFWGWRMSVNAGVLAADSTYHRYYYDVANQYSTDVRPYYQASGGYSGAFTQLSFSKKLDRWRFGLALRYDYLQGAAFMDSPLVQTPHYSSVSFGVIRTLWNN